MINPIETLFSCGQAHGICAIVPTMRIWIILLVLALPSYADGIYNGKTVDCYCTDRTGERVELGDTVCLHVDGKSFMAQCQMSLNNPMWRKVGDGCITSYNFNTRKTPAEVGAEKSG